MLGLRMDDICSGSRGDILFRMSFVSRFTSMAAAMKPLVN